MGKYPQAPLGEKIKQLFHSHLSERRVQEWVCSLSICHQRLGRFRFHTGNDLYIYACLFISTGF